MGKDKTLPKFALNQAGATAKYLRIPPRKARLVLDAVRGKYVHEAIAVLKFVPNFAADAIIDVLNSAVANAENSRPKNAETGRLEDPLIAENLKLVRAYVDEGPRIKRLQPRAQGRAYRIVKRMCHITVVVEEVGPKPRKVQNAKAKRAVAAGRTVTAATPAPKVEEAAVSAPAVVAEAEVTTPVVAEVEETTPVVAATEATPEVEVAAETSAEEVTDETTAEAPAAE